MRLIGLVSLACMLVEGAQLRRADAAIRLRARAKEPEPEPRALPSWLALDVAALAGNLKDYGAAICRGTAIGYLGINAVAEFPTLLLRALAVPVGIFRGLIRGHRKPPPAAEKATVEGEGVAGRWVIDTARSESLEPFLVAVGAPKLVARLVGRKGVPMTIAVDGGAVTVTLDGKPAEKVGLRGGATELTTPRGKVKATASVSSRRLTVVKAGPAAGETTTEVRELEDKGAVLRCTFSHAGGGAGGETVTVTRYYTRVAV